MTEGEHTDGVVLGLDVNLSGSMLEHDSVLAQAKLRRFDGHKLDRWLRTKDGLGEDLALVVPRHVTDRLSGQDGSLAKNADPQGWRKDLVEEIQVPCQAKPRLFIELKCVGISYATPYADLGGLVRQIGCERTGWRSRLTTGR